MAPTLEERVSVLEANRSTFVELQKKTLKKVEAVEGRLEAVETSVKGLRTDVNDMKAEQKLTNERMNDLEAGQQETNNLLAQILARLDGPDAD